VIPGRAAARPAPCFQPVVGWVCCSGRSLRGPAFCWPRPGRFWAGCRAPGQKPFGRAQITAAGARHHLHALFAPWRGDLPKVCCVPPGDQCPGWEESGLGGASWVIRMLQAEATRAGAGPLSTSAQDAGPNPEGDGVVALASAGPSGAALPPAGWPNPIGRRPQPRPEASASAACPWLAGAQRPTGGVASGRLAPSP
jgi:hypothetical protein